MNIKGIDNLDIGMSNIEIEGEVTYTEIPEHREGESPKAKGGHYDFWSQRIFIDDGTGNIECSISVKDENDGIIKGVVARVKGKLTEWQGKRKIQGKLIAISKGDKTTDVQQERAEEYFEEKAKIDRLANKVKGKDDEQITKENKLDWSKHPKEIPILDPVKPKPENSVWEAKDLRIARECAVKAVTELTVAKIITGKQFFPFANTIVKYIYNGKVNGKEKKSILRDDRRPLEIISEDQLFPDEVREEIENAVNEKEKEKENSYHNAIPFKGKRKKAAVAEDFINEEDDKDFIHTEVLD